MANPANASDSWKGLYGVRRIWRSPKAKSQAISALPPIPTEDPHAISVTDDNIEIEAAELLAPKSSPEPKAAEPLAPKQQNCAGLFSAFFQYKHISRIFIHEIPRHRARDDTIGSDDKMVDGTHVQTRYHEERTSYFTRGFMLFYEIGCL